KLEINGIAVTSSDQPNPMQVQWPGGGGRTAAPLTLPGTPPSGGDGGPGQWALFRLLDKASETSPPPNAFIARWSAPNPDVSFQFGPGPYYSPLHLPALTEFKCPATL